jgi:tetratricopeptide (TPR) repeat protein
LTFVGGIIICGFRQKSFFALSGIIIFAAMGCFCFAFYAPQVAIVFAFYAAIINSKTREKSLPKIIPSIVAVASVVALLCVCFQISAQMQMKTIETSLKQKNISAAKKAAEKHFYFVTTSEIYHRTLADVFFAEKDYKTAAQYYQTAIMYAPFPATLSKLAYCEVQIENFAESERLLSLAAKIQPSSFEPYLNLLMLYIQTNETEKAQAAAKYIAEKKPKRETKKIKQYKEFAKRYLSKHPKP